MIPDINIPFAKTLKPTMEEFQDFEQFFENCDKDRSLANYGVYKVVPPKGWKARKQPIEEKFSTISVISPIEQNAQGKAGVYEMLLIQKKSMKVSEYKKKVESQDEITNGKTTDEVEDTFLRNIAFSPPLYGADMAGNLFDEDALWNLKSLPGLLRDGLTVPLSGVTNPYLYIGAWKTLFGWHKEDLDLYSINFLHYGKPKFWYCLAPTEQKKIEDFARRYFAEGFSKCRDFMRHKTVMINPYLLKKEIPDLKIHKMIQYPGEFVITSGGSYHAGFNWGFNIAEAVNFATTRWLEILPNADSCRCISDAVKMDKGEFYQNLLKHPVYGKQAHVRKICQDYLVKEGIPIDDKDNESEETDDSRGHKTSAGKSNKKKDGKIESEEETKSTDKKKGKANKKPAKKADHDEKENEEGEEEIATPELQQRISSRTKKIKKLGEEFETDYKILIRSKPALKVQAAKKAVHNGAKELDNWIMCDHCEKWRLVDDSELMLKLKKKKKIDCSLIPGRNCDQPDDNNENESNKIIDE